MRVTDTKIAQLSRQEGRHRVDDNLYLYVRGSGRPGWCLRFVAPDGQRRDMSLGTYPFISLAAAREKATHWRSILAQGHDPIEVRRAEKHARANLRHENKYTLRVAAEELHEVLKPTWKNDKHAAQWISSLNHLGKLLDTPLTEIDSAALLEKLEPLNLEMHETATRIRQRVEAIFDRAMVLGKVKHNPATPLVRMLRKPKNARHFPSLPYQQVPEFVMKLRDSDAAQSTRLGFEFLILSAGRTIEVCEMAWSELNQDRTIWTVPADKMKCGSPHEVPVTARMRAILTAMEMQCGEDWDWVFPSPQSLRKPLSRGAFLAAIRRMGMTGMVTPHGMRSSFSTWAYETQSHRSEIIEAALAHKETVAVKAAYNRAEYWGARCELAVAWEQHVLG